MQLYNGGGPVIRPALLLAGLSFFAISAHAEEMPRYDVAGHCDEVASFSGASSEVIRKGCFQQEQAAYDVLKRSWSSIPVNARAHCDEVARFGGAGSYLILKGCIDMEKSATESTPEFKY